MYIHLSGREHIFVQAVTPVTHNPSIPSGNSLPGLPEDVLSDTSALLRDIRFVSMGVGSLGLYLDLPRENVSVEGDGFRGGRPWLRPGSAWAESRAWWVDRTPGYFVLAEENRRPLEPACSSSVGEGQGPGSRNLLHPGSPAPMGSAQAHSLHIPPGHQASVVAPMPVPCLPPWQP